MGRKRKITLSDLGDRILECKCGKGIQVTDNSVVSVTCIYCLTNTVPYSMLNQEQKDKVDANEQELLNKEKSQPAKISKNGKVLGRPRKAKPENESYHEHDIIMKKKAQRKELDEIYKRGSKPTVTIESTKPTKVKSASRVAKPVAKPVAKQEKIKVKPFKKGKSVMDKKAKGKRGRKATVGDKVMTFIKSQQGNVEFKDILKVYSEERERLGKKSTPKIEERNCRSTLYVLVNYDKRLMEVEPKRVYTTI